MVALTVNGGIPGREMFVFIVVPGGLITFIALCWNIIPVDIIGTGAAACC